MIAFKQLEFNLNLLRTVCLTHLNCETTWYFPNSAIFIWKSINYKWIFGHQTVWILLFAEIVHNKFWKVFLKIFFKENKQKKNGACVCFLFFSVCFLIEFLMTNKNKMSHNFILHSYNVGAILKGFRRTTSTVTFILIWYKIKIKAASVSVCEVDSVRPEDINLLLCDP